jgi:hypothetical protein
MGPGKRWAELRSEYKVGLHRAEIVLNIKSLVLKSDNLALSRAEHKRNENNFRFLLLYRINENI